MKFVLLMPVSLIPNKGPACNPLSVFETKTTFQLAGFEEWNENPEGLSSYLSEYFEEETPEDIKAYWAAELAEQLTEEYKKEEYAAQCERQRIEQNKKRF